MLTSTSKNASRAVRRRVPGLMHRALATEATASSARSAANRSPNTLFAANSVLERHAASGKPIGALMGAISMKVAGIRPDIHTYYYLMEALSKGGEWREAWALLEDAKRAGVRVDASLYNRLLYGVSREAPDVSWQVFESMQKDQVEPNEETYQLMLARYIHAHNLEMSVKLLFEMEKHEFHPSLDTAQLFLNLALDRGLVRLAHEIARNFEDGGLRTLQPEMWVKMLTVATDLYYSDGLPAIWKKVVHDLNLTPDEGTCVEALQVAGRFGLADIAVDALRTLRQQQVRLQEYHFAPMVQAFVRTGQLKDAFAVLCMLRVHSLPVTAATSQPILQAVQLNPSLMEQAWGAIEELQKEGTTIDVACVNVLIHASVVLGDLQRALGAHSILPELGLTSSPETFEILMKGALSAENRALGEKLLQDMAAAKIVPTAETYEHAIALALTGDDYENAFQYLEDMKAAGNTPSATVYEAIIRRCIVGQDERYFMAVDEMRAHGYRHSRQLDEWLFKQHDARRQAQAKAAKAAADAEPEYI